MKVIIAIFSFVIFLFTSISGQVKFTDTQIDQFNLEYDQLLQDTAKLRKVFLASKYCAKQLIKSRDAIRLTELESKLDSIKEENKRLIGIETKFKKLKENNEKLAIREKDLLADSLSSIKERDSLNTLINTLRKEIQIKDTLVQNIEEYKTEELANLKKEIQKYISNDDFSGNKINGFKNRLSLAMILVEGDNDLKALSDSLMKFEQIVQTIQKAKNTLDNNYQKENIRTNIAALNGIPITSFNAFVEPTKKAFVKALDNYCQAYKSTYNFFNAVKEFEHDDDVSSTLRDFRKSKYAPAPIYTFLVKELNKRETTPSSRDMPLKQLGACTL